MTSPWDHGTVRRPSSPTGPPTRNWLVLVLLVALTLRAVLAFVKGGLPYFSDTDEYDAAARSILAGHGVGPSIPRAPLFPAFMAAVYVFCGVGNYFAVRLAEIPFSLVIVLLTGWIGLRAGGPRVGLLAAAAAAVAPTLVYTSTMLYPTMLYSLILLGITALALRIDRAPSLGLGAALGILIALGWLTDQVILIPVLGVLAWIAAGRRSKGALGALVLALVLTLAIVIPVARFQRAAYGTPSFFLSKAELVLYAARHDTVSVGGHALRDTSSQFVPLPAGALVRRELGLLVTRPGDYLHDYVLEFLHFFQPYPDRIVTANRFTGAGGRWLVTIYFVPAILLALAGALAGAASRRDRLLLAAVPLATAATYALLFSQVRYRVPIEPQLLVLAALGAERLIARARPASDAPVSAAVAASPPP